MSGTIIDGIGDEVTIIGGIFFTIIVGIITWMSTYVEEPNASQNNENIDEDLIQGTEDFVSEAGGWRQTEEPEPNPPEEPAAPEDTYTSAEPTNFPESDNITIRLKFINDTERTITANLNETLAQFRHKNFPPETAMQYRFIYHGQVLRDSSRTLRDYNLAPTEDAPNGAVVHCFYSATTNSSTLPTDATSQQEMQAEEMNIGRYFVPLVGSALALIWYLCVFYTYLFTIQSIVSITGLTLMFTILCLNRFF